MLLGAARRLTARAVPSKAKPTRKYATEVKKSVFSRPTRPETLMRSPPAPRSDYVKMEPVEGLTVHSQGIQLEESAGSSDIYHWVWLRDHCSCKKCQSSSGQKLYRIETFDPPVAGAGQARVNDKEVRITWYDGHESTYSRTWLRKHSYSNESNLKHMKANKTASWDAEIITKSGGIPSFSYEAVINDEAQMHNWLTDLDFFGVTLLKNAPKERGVVTKLTNMVGYPRNTMYGLSWDVESLPNPNNVAYTSLPLPLHADLCYYESPPGVQLLHCIKFEQKTGGENLFVDAFRVAEDLRNSHPQAFQALASVPTIFHKDDEHHMLKYGHPIIELSPHSAVIKAINWSPPFEGVQRIPVNLVQEYYAARKIWNRLLNDPKYTYQHRSEPGDVVVFNNRRVLHSRTEFDEKAGHRLLEGAYIGSDEWTDKLRALNRKYAPAANIHDGSGYTL